MHTVSIFGAGKIGETIAALLSESNRYQIRLCDQSLARAQEIASQWKNVTAFQIDLSNEPQSLKTLEGCEAVISALPFSCNVFVAKLAGKAKVHYLDLTEDIETSRTIEQLAQGASTCFMPQCGLAPGFISIATADLIPSFEVVEQVKMRVGALPLYPTNRLKYNLTWSTEGLINEYGNLCEAIYEGKKQQVLPLEGYERFLLDGQEYEAFNTSGGLGTICETYANRVKSLDYKSVRYPGHRELIAFLMEDLRFNEDRTLLKKIFERSIPLTHQDKCLVLVEVTGTVSQQLLQRTYASTVYHQTVANHHYGAIQVTTASGICVPLDMILTKKLGVQGGFIRNEEIPLSDFIAHEFGKYYRDERALTTERIS